MLPERQAFSWLILCPTAIVTNCLAALTITHYKRAYIGTDMIIMCLLSTMAMNAGLLLAPAIFVMLNIQSWPHDFCLFYIWAFGFLRSMGLVGLFVLSFHWSYLSRMTPLHRVQTSSRPVICALIVIVLISVVVGLLPLVRMMMRESAGAESSEESSSVILLSSIFDEKKQVCAFLTYDAEPVLAIFIIILTLMVFLAMIICLTDSGILLHSYKIMFIVKYKSGGFYDPEQARSLWSQSGLVSDTYSEINNTFDLWRVVLLQFLLCTLLNHIPYVIMEILRRAL